jgi:hypothetical protein
MTRISACAKKDREFFTILTRAKNLNSIRELNRPDGNPMLTKLAFQECYWVRYTDDATNYRWTSERFKQSLGLRWVPDPVFFAECLRRMHLVFVERHGNHHKLVDIRDSEFNVLWTAEETL